MHVQIINFNLTGVTEEQYGGLCDQLASTFAAVPGLLSKVWLADPETNTYGGVYLWKDREALDAYKQSELFQMVATHPNLENVTSKEFGILEGPTEVTRGLVAAAVGVPAV